MCVSLEPFFFSFFAFGFGLLLARFLLRDAVQQLVYLVKDALQLLLHLEAKTDVILIDKAHVMQLLLRPRQIVAQDIDRPG